MRWVDHVAHTNCSPESQPLGFWTLDVWRHIYSRRPWIRSVVLYQFASDTCGIWNNLPSASVCIAAAVYSPEKTAEGFICFWRLSWTVEWGYENVARQRTSCYPRALLCLCSINFVFLLNGRPWFDPRVRKRIFYPTLCVQTVFGVHPVSYSMGTAVVTLVTHSHLVPRLRTRKSCTCSLLKRIRVCDGTTRFFDNILSTNSSYFSFKWDRVHHSFVLIWRQKIRLQLIDLD